MVDAAAFHELGYAILPSCIDDQHAAALRADIDALEIGRVVADEQQQRTAVHIAAQPVLGALVVFEPLAYCVRSLMASHLSGLPAFALHHQHALRMDAGTTGGAVWHHDYEQHPQQDHGLLMVHCFVYPNGLDGQIGDLILLPRSHTVVMDRGRDVIGGLFGSEPLPGSITISHLEPGSVVVVHSALLHGRRAKPGGASRPRYFTDISFCQHPRNDSAQCTW